MSHIKMQPLTSRQRAPIYIGVISRAFSYVFSQCVQTLKSFRADTKGLAALEFALAMPLLMVLLMGGFELARLSLLNMKIEKIAFTVADVTSQNKALTNSQVTDIFEAAKQIASPFDFDTMGVAYVTSAYRATGDIYPTVRWQRSGGGLAALNSKIGSTGLTATLPNDLSINEKDNVIVAEVYFQYEPLFNIGVTSANTIYKTTIFKPRLGDLTTPPT